MNCLTILPGVKATRDKAQVFLGKTKQAGLHVYLSRHGVEVNGERRAAEAARKALRDIPLLAGEVKPLLKPSEADLQHWLSLQDDAVREGHAARVERLRAAGIQEPERVALRTTYQDNLDVLPDRLRPKVGSSK